MTPRNNRKRFCRENHRGMVLFVVAIVIAMVAVGALALLSLRTTEYEATVLRGDEIQAGQLVQSGIEYVAQMIDTPQQDSVSAALSASMPASLEDAEPFAQNLTDVSAQNSFFGQGDPQTNETTSTEGSPNNLLYDNPDRFRGIMVAPSSSGRPSRGPGRFTVFSPRIEQDRLRGVRFGLVNESTRLHLGAVLDWEIESPGQGSRSLLKLPGMTPSMADSILDWIDADKSARSSGAELEYYERTGVPYRPRNAVPTTLEELLLVRDVTRTLLFGKDESFSYGAKMSDLQQIQAEADAQADLLFQNTDDFGSSQSSDSASDGNFFDGMLDDGLSDVRADGSLPWCFLLTTLSAEKLLDPKGNARIFLNDDNLDFLEEQLKTNLDNDSVQFLMAWRKTNGKIDDPIDLLDATVKPKPEANEKDRAPDDPAKKTEKLTEELKSPFTLDNPEGEERFLKLLDYATSSQKIVLSGRINVNEASRTVLQAIPELDNDIVAKIIGKRSASGDSNAVGGRSEERPGNRFRHPVWLLSEKIVDKETMKKLSKRLTTGGDVYRAQVVGFFDGQGTTSRAEIVVDATVKPPRQIFSKDLTMFGSGFD